MSNVHRNEICERCFLYRSLEFCKSCHQCPTCCYRSSCRGKVTPVLGEMGSSGFESKSSHHTEGGLHLPLPVQTQIDKVTNCNKQLLQSSQAVLPVRGTVSADKQECSRTGRKSKLTGFLQLAIFGTQTQQLVEIGPGPEHLEHLFKHRVIQNGDPRDNKKLPTGRGMGHIHRLQRRILPYTNSQSVQEVHAFSPLGSVLPVQSPTLWSIHSSHGVHSGDQRGQTHGTSGGYKGLPVPRRLAGESLYHSPAYTNLCNPLSRTRVAGEQGKLAPKQVLGYQFDLKEGKVRPTTERWQVLTDKIQSILSGQPLHPLKLALQIFTDASKEGWGTHLDKHTARGTWSLPEIKLHINHLELKAVFLALNEFRTLCCNKTVLIATDNTTVVAYINKQGGMKSGSLCALLWRILSWCTRQQVTLRARHIPGWLNVIADKLSRLGQTIQSGHFIQKCSKLYAPGGISPKWTCLPPGSTTNFHSLCHRTQTPRHGQWMHSAFLGRNWTHTPFYQQPSWAKWWRSYRTTLATG